MEQNNKTSIFDKNRILIKGFLIGFLILLMLIPKFMVNDVINERRHYQSEVVKEVSSKWAGEQVVAGPILVVPYNKHSIAKDGKKVTTKKKVYILPEKLKINGEVTTETKKRSIYHVSLYRSDMTLEGNFSSSPIKKLNINPDDIIWNESRLVMGISDAKGLEEEVTLDWADNTSIMEPGIQGAEIFDTELGANIKLNLETNSQFNIKLKMKGSSDLQFVPVGKTTDVMLSSNWKDPSFNGYYLPDTNNDTDGFKAKWRVLHVSRSFPQYWDGYNNKNTNKMYDNSFGVKLIQPADHYAKSNRSIKYALLIIALTFTVFFFMEVIQKIRIHPLQYILVGMALIIFYTLLLSISEYIGFNSAYMVAAVATVALIGLYVWSVIKKWKIAIGFTFSLTALYAYLFMLIQLKEYALISGSIGLFFVLAIIMYFSRKIDWYSTNKQIEDHE
ncbi:MAG: cell envelope integrity protein CreD [Flavipsychrobacter sp.]